MARLAGSKTTEFKLYAPLAKKVSLAGSFNKWDTKTYCQERLKRQLGG